MAVISWNGASNLDLKILGQTFDFRSDVLQVSDPSIQANQFDLVENGVILHLLLDPLLQRNDRIHPIHRLRGKQRGRREAGDDES